MRITLNRIDDDFLFEMKNQNGHTILIDNITRENPKGVSPMESLLMAVAGCSGIDMISILKKQRQTITNFSADVDGERVQVEDAKPFRKIIVTFFIDGDVDAAKAQKAADLSFGKYCSVSKTLDPQIDVQYKVIVNG